MRTSGRADGEDEGQGHEPEPEAQDDPSSAVVHRYLLLLVAR